MRQRQVGSWEEEMIRRVSLRYGWATRSEKPSQGDVLNVCVVISLLTPFLLSLLVLHDQ